ncbi:MULTISPECIES: 50S ribosomal protein L24 [unclassified Sneathiella]|jgi:large subunit ribosomal protein L24|uniref:50S ribosomal protein L24 n=1 Tax=unclassified Sneathiella TaxID=2614935 RepID=UPI001D142BA8|nr:MULTISPECIES: 50S ribosomal protein L24 [unclassified Sneathiella]MCC3304625.1 50S ribosomal protein L24 [Sneathiella sp. HT1-7]MDF2367895.1 50S ribosomal protein L24 [Sneathiella sp.]
MAEKFAVKKGDKVVVLTGKDKGRTGEVLSVRRKDRRVFVSGINMVKRHTKPSQADQGGIVEKEAAIHISNIALQDPKDGKATRVGYKNLDDGRKVRFAKRSGEVIDI